MKTETTLGKLIDGKAERDAVHFACAPMEAACDLSPGERVGIVSFGLAGRCEPYVGIVDPFLTDQVLKGQKFWLVLLPHTVTGIRHCWEHPAFPSPSGDVKENDEACRWITAFAGRWSLSFSEFMDGAREYIRNGTELDDNWIQLDISDADWATFWEKFHTLTSLSVGDKYMEFVKCCPN